MVIAHPLICEDLLLFQRVSDIVIEYLNYIDNQVWIDSCRILKAFHLI